MFPAFCKAPRALLFAASSLFLLLATVAVAQTSSATAPAATMPGASAAATHLSGVTAPAPAARGLNLTFGSTAQHSSVTDWSWWVTPNVSFRANRFLSFDAGVPWYLRAANLKEKQSGATTTYVLKQGSNLPGDAVLSGHLNGQAGDFGLGLNASGALPTGDKSFGLSAGVPTYNVTSHADYSIGPFNPDIEAGIGTSSRLVNNGVSKSYTSAGAIANFQLGAGIDLPRRLSLDVEGYEAMPLANQTVYGTVTRKHGHSKGKGKGNQPIVTVISGSGSAEDNGITAEFDVPVSRHLSFAWMFDHSIIQNEDVTGFTLTWVVRAPRRTAE